MRYQVVSADDHDWNAVSADGVEEHTLFDDYGSATKVALILAKIYGDPGCVCVIERDDLVSSDLRKEICKRAKATAALFFEEFGEPIDPDSTDWDGTAWGEDRIGLDIEDCDCNAWEIYQDALIAETKRLYEESK